MEHLEMPAQYIRSIRKQRVVIADILILQFGDIQVSTACSSLRHSGLPPSHNTATTRHTESRQQDKATFRHDGYRPDVQLPHGTT